MPRLYQYKLSEEQELELVARLRAGELRTHLAIAFGVSPTTVTAILRRYGVPKKLAHIHSIYKPKRSEAKPSTNAALPIAPGLFQSEALARARLMAGR